MSLLFFWYFFFGLKLTVFLKNNDSKGMRDTYGVSLSPTLRCHTTIRFLSSTDVHWFMFCTNLWYVCSFEDRIKHSTECTPWCWRQSAKRTPHGQGWLHSFSDRGAPSYFDKRLLAKSTAAFRIADKTTTGALLCSWRGKLLEDVVKQFFALRSDALKVS